MVAHTVDQLSEVEWGEAHRVLLSLSYGKTTSETYPIAIEYLREGLREQIEDVLPVSVVDEIEDNLTNTDGGTLRRLGRTLDVDNFLLVDIWAIGFRRLDEWLASALEFQAEAYVSVNLFLFGTQEGHYFWSEAIVETHKGAYTADVATIPTVEPSRKVESYPVLGEPYTLLLRPGVTHRELVWSPDSQVLLFWSGALEEVGGRHRLVGNIWLSDLSGRAHQLTWLSALENPWTYVFLPDGERIILVTNNKVIKVIDRDGQILRSMSVAPFSVGHSGFKPVPGKRDLLAMAGGTGSSTDHPDGLWVIALDSETFHPFAELYNGGQPLVRLVKERFLLGPEFIHLDSDFSWSADGQAIVFSTLQLPVSNVWHRTFLRFDLGSRALAFVGAVDAGAIAGLAFSPGADRAAFAIVEDNACLLTIVGVRENPVRVNDAGCAFVPAWSPDGAWIAYAYTTGKGSPVEVWLVSADGSGPRSIADIQAESIGGLAWSPDGRHLALSARVGGDAGIWILPIVRGGQ